MIMVVVLLKQHKRFSDIYTLWLLLAVYKEACTLLQFKGADIVLICYLCSSFLIYMFSLVTLCRPPLLTVCKPSLMAQFDQCFCGFSYIFVTCSYSYQLSFVFCLVFFNLILNLPSKTFMICFDLCYLLFKKLVFITLLFHTSTSWHACQHEMQSG